MKLRWLVRISARAVLLAWVGGTLGCARVTMPPATPKASVLERRATYERYRLEAFDESTALRADGRLGLRQLHTLTAACPEANRLIETDSIGPPILGAIGGGLMGYGLIGLLIDKGPDALTSKADDRIIVGVGGGVALLAVVLELALQPPPPDMARVTRLYNDCLRRDLALVPQAPPDPEAEDKADYPWRIKVAPASPPPMSTSTSTTPSP